MGGAPPENNQEKAMELFKRLNSAYENWRSNE